MTVFQRLKTLWGTRSNLLIDAGIPGFRHGDVAKVDRLSAYLPWDAVDEYGRFILKGKRPDESEGLGFTIEIFPQTGVTGMKWKSRSLALRLRFRLTLLSQSRPTRPLRLKDSRN